MIIQQFSVVLNLIFRFSRDFLHSQLYIYINHYSYLSFVTKNEAYYFPHRGIVFGSSLLVHYAYKLIYLQTSKLSKNGSTNQRSSGGGNTKNSNSQRLDGNFCNSIIWYNLGNSVCSTNTSKGNNLKKSWWDI